MQAIYFYGIPANQDPMIMNVNEINGSGSSYGPLADLISSDSRFCWGAFCSMCDVIPSCDDTISDIQITNGMVNYSGTLVSFIGGRPARPISK